MRLRRLLIAVTIFNTLLRWNAILYILDNLHVVSSLLDQCSKNEHMQNVLMHMRKLRKFNTYVQTSPKGPKLLVQHIKIPLNKVMVQNGLTQQHNNEKTTSNASNVRWFLDKIPFISLTEANKNAYRYKKRLLNAVSMEYL